MPELGRGVDKLQCYMHEQDAVTGNGVCCTQSDESAVELSRCVLDTKKGNSDTVAGFVAYRSSVKLRECRVLRSGMGVALSQSQGVLADCEFETSEVASVLADEAVS